MVSKRRLVVPKSRGMKKLQAILRSNPSLQFHWKSHESIINHKSFALLYLFIDTTTIERPKCFSHPTKTPASTRCHHPAENWLCLSCKDVLCSRFVNKHMLQHYQEVNHCLALSYSDLSVWCFSCNAYLDVLAIWQLQSVYGIAHLLKFGEAPPFRTIECMQVSSDQAAPSSSSRS